MSQELVYLSVELQYLLVMDVWPDLGTTGCSIVHEKAAPVLVQYSDVYTLSSLFSLVLSTLLNCLNASFDSKPPATTVYCLDFPDCRVNAAYLHVTFSNVTVTNNRSSCMPGANGDFFIQCILKYKNE